METVIQVNNLVKRYKEVLALDHLNLEVKKGEIFGLLGPNGSGKTTAINCILALLTYDKGEIEVFGKPMTPNAYDSKARIGIVPQEVTFFYDLTVWENVDFFCSLYVSDKQKRKQLVQEAIEFCQLEKYTKFKARKLSGGLMRRLHIACGIAHKPELIILDEPTVAVDAQSRQFILDGIKKLNEQGSTIVYDPLPEGRNLCERFAIWTTVKRSPAARWKLKGLITTTGRPARTARAAGRLKDKIEALPGLESLERKNGTLVLRFGRDSYSLNQLIELLETEGVGYTTLYSTQPSLSEIFLSLTGRDLRE